jgi:hypothetical protein
MGVGEQIAQRHYGKRLAQRMGSRPQSWAKLDIGYMAYGGRQSI